MLCTRVRISQQHSVHYNGYNSYTIHTTKTHSANLYLHGFSPVIVVHCECSWSPWAATAIDRWQVQPFWSTQCSLHSYCTAGALWLHTRFGQRLMQCGRLTKKAYLWCMLGASFNGWGCCTGPRDKVFDGPIPPRLDLYVVCSCVICAYICAMCVFFDWLVGGGEFPCSGWPLFLFLVNSGSTSKQGFKLIFK